MAEIRAPGGHQILLVGREREHAVLTELTQTAHARTESLGGATEHGGGERASVAGAYMKTERARAVEFAPPD